MQITDPIDATTMSGDFGPLLLTDNSDGTVQIEMPSTIELAVTDASGRQDSANIVVTLRGQTMAASGTADSISYDFSADKYGLKLSEIQENGAPIDMVIDVALNNAVGSYLIEGSAATGLATASTLDADILTFIFGFSESGEQADFAGQINGFSTTNASNLPPNYDPLSTDLSQLAKLAATFELATQGSTMHFSYDSPRDGTGQLVLTTGGGRTALEIVDGVLSYSDLSTSISAQLNGTEFPFPVNFSAGSLGFGVTMPFVQDDQVQPIGQWTDITDLTIDENIWAMVDPMGAFPHDPVTLSYNLEGTGRVLANFADEDAMAELLDSGVPPFELESLSLSSFILSALGAQMIAAGDFTFDNADLETFDGFPAPEGRIDLRGKGINGLLDTLAAMPFGIDEEIMGARMMLGMFTSVVGDDELTSTIEVKKNGSVSVNGQRMR